MSKDTITVNMNVYDIPIVVEQLNKLEQENQQLKEKLNCDLQWALKYDELYFENQQLKEVIEEIREYMKKNRTRYIYQDSLGEDWRFDDLDVYSELLQILDKTKEE